MRIPFETVPTYPNEFAVWFKTNNAPNETSWQIYNLENDSTIYSSDSVLSPDTEYRDTLAFDPGFFKNDYDRYRWRWS